MSTVSVISASPPASRRATCIAAMLTPGLAEEGADRADHAGAVDVAEEQQHAVGVELQVEAVQLGELERLARPAAGTVPETVTTPAVGQRAAHA